MSNQAALQFTAIAAEKGLRLKAKMRELPFGVQAWASASLESWKPFFFFATCDPHPPPIEATIPNQLKAMS